MISLKTVNTAVRVVDKVTCDFCGKDIPKNASGEFDDYVHIEKTWGYHSHKDGETTVTDICEECFDKLLMKRQ